MSQSGIIVDQPSCSCSNVNSIISAPDEEEISNEFYSDTKLCNGNSKNISKTSLEKHLSSKMSLSKRKSSYTVSSCRICLSRLENPGVLKCGHCFCGECLYKYWKNGESAECIVCPLCRACTDKIDFVEKDNQSTPALCNSFVNSFGNMENTRKTKFTSLCVKTSIILPALFCFTKCLKWLFIDYFFRN